MRTISFLILTLFGCGCSVSEDEVQHAFNRHLGESFAGQFKIVKSEYSPAIGEELSTVEVQFTAEGLNALLTAVPIQDRIEFDGGWRVEKTLPFDSTGSSHHYFFFLTCSKASQKVQIQFGDE